MSRSHWTTRIFKTFLWLGAGVLLLGQSCGLAIRDSAVSAGAGFVGSSVTAILQQLIPVQSWLGGSSSSSSSSSQ